MRQMNDAWKANLLESIRYYGSRIGISPTNLLTAKYGLYGANKEKYYHILDITGFRRIQILPDYWKNHILPCGGAIHHYEKWLYVPREWHSVLLHELGHVIDYHVNFPTNDIFGFVNTNLMNKEAVASVFASFFHTDYILTNSYKGYKQIAGSITSIQEVKTRVTKCLVFAKANGFTWDPSLSCI